MVKVAATFFVMGLFVFFLGWTKAAGMTPHVAKIFFITFSCFSILTFVAALTTGNLKTKE